MVDAGLEVGGVRHGEQVAAERAAPERLDGAVELRARLGDGLVGERLPADLLHDAADLGGGHPCHHHLGHRGDQGGLAALVVLEHQRLERRVAMPRNREIDGADPRD